MKLILTPEEWNELRRSTHALQWAAMGQPVGDGKDQLASFAPWLLHMLASSLHSNTMEAVVDYSPDGTSLPLVRPVAPFIIHASRGDAIDAVRDARQTVLVKRLARRSFSVYLFAAIWIEDDFLHAEVTTDDGQVSYRQAAYAYAPGDAASYLVDRCCQGIAQYLDIEARRRLGYPVNL